MTGRKRQPFTQQHRDNIAKAFLGKPGTRKGVKMSQERLIEYRKTIAESPVYSERNRKISVAKKGKKQSPEHTRKNSESHKGQPSWCKGLTAETDPRVKKIADNMKGREMNDEWCTNISKAKKGKTSPKKGMPSGKKGQVKNAELHIRRWFAKLPMRFEVGRCEWYYIYCKTGKNNGFYGKKHSEKSLELMSNKAMNNKHVYTNSKPERMMQIALALNNIKFETQKVIRFGKSWHPVDIFIEPNICVEVDGVRFHTMLHHIQRDMFVNQELTIMGYHIIRIRDKDIVKNTQNCAEKVIQLIKELQHKTIDLG